MRPTTPIKASRPIRDRPAACACAALALLLPVLAPTAPALAAGEAGNVFGGGAQPSSQAGKPAGASKPAAAGGQAGQSGSASSHTSQGGSQPAKPPVKLSQAEKAKLLQSAKAQLNKQMGGTSKATNTSTAATTPEPGSKTSAPMIMALVAGVLVLGGIAFVIVRDARSVAPVVEGMASGGTRNPEGRMRKRRAQAKAARRQRKRHRKR